MTSFVRGGGGAPRAQSSSYSREVHAPAQHHHDHTSTLHAFHSMNSYACCVCINIWTNEIKLTKIVHVSHKILSQRCGKRQPSYQQQPQLNTLMIYDEQMAEERLKLEFTIFDAPLVYFTHKFEYVAYDITRPVYLQTMQN